MAWVQWDTDAKALILLLVWARKAILTSTGGGNNIWYMYGVTQHTKVSVYVTLMISFKS